MNISKSMRVRSSPPVTITKHGTSGSTTTPLGLPFPDVNICGVSTPEKFPSRTPPIPVKCSGLQPHDQANPLRTRRIQTKTTVRCNQVTRTVSVLNQKVPPPFADANAAKCSLQNCCKRQQQPSSSKDASASNNETLRSLNANAKRVISAKKPPNVQRKPEVPQQLGVDSVQKNHTIKVGVNAPLIHGDDHPLRHKILTPDNSNKQKNDEVTTLLNQLRNEIKDSKKQCAQMNEKRVHELKDEIDQFRNRMMTCNCLKMILDDPNKLEELATILNRNTKGETETLKQRLLKPYSESVSSSTKNQSTTQDPFKDIEEDNLEQIMQDEKQLLIELRQSILDEEIAQQQYIGERLAIIDEEIEPFEDSEALATDTQIPKISQSATTAIKGLSAGSLAPENVGIASKAGSLSSEIPKTNSNSSQVSDIIMEKKFAYITTKPSNERQDHLHAIAQVDDAQPDATVNVALAVDNEVQSKASTIKQSKSDSSRSVSLQHSKSSIGEAKSFVSGTDVSGKSHMSTSSRTDTIMKSSRSQATENIRVLTNEAPEARVVANVSSVHIDRTKSSLQAVMSETLMEFEPQLVQKLSTELTRKLSIGSQQKSYDVISLVSEHNSQAKSVHAVASDSGQHLESRMVNVVVNEVLNDFIDRIVQRSSERLLSKLYADSDVDVTDNFERKLVENENFIQSNSSASVVREQLSRILNGIDDFDNTQFQENFNTAEDSCDCKTKVPNFGDCRCCDGTAKQVVHTDVHPVSVLINSVESEANNKDSIEPRLFTTEVKAAEDDEMRDLHLTTIESRTNLHVGSNQNKIELESERNEKNATVESILGEEGDLAHRESVAATSVTDRSVISQRKDVPSDVSLCISNENRETEKVINLKQRQGSLSVGVPAPQKISSNSSHERVSGSKNISKEHNCIECGCLANLEHQVIGTQQTISRTAATLPNNRMRASQSSNGTLYVKKITRRDQGVENMAREQLKKPLVGSYGRMNVTTALTNREVQTSNASVTMPSLYKCVAAGNSRMDVYTSCNCLTLQNVLSKGTDCNIAVPIQSSDNYTSKSIVTSGSDQLSSYSSSGFETCGNTTTDSCCRCSSATTSESISSSDSTYSSDKTDHNRSTLPPVAACCNATTQPTNCFMSSCSKPQKLSTKTFLTHSPSAKMSDIPEESYSNCCGISGKCGRACCQEKGRPSSTNADVITKQRNKPCCSPVGHAQPSGTDDVSLSNSCPSFHHPSFASDFSGHRPELEPNQNLGEAVQLSIDKSPLNERFFAKPKQPLVESVEKVNETPVVRKVSFQGNLTKSSAQGVEDLPPEKRSNTVRLKHSANGNDKENVLDGKSGNNVDEECTCSKYAKCMELRIDGDTPKLTSASESGAKDNDPNAVMDEASHLIDEVKDYLTAIQSKLSGNLSVQHIPSLSIPSTPRLSIQPNFNLTISTDSPRPTPTTNKNIGYYEFKIEDTPTEVITDTDVDCIIMKDVLSVHDIGSETLLSDKDIMQKPCKEFSNDGDSAENCDCCRASKDLVERVAQNIVNLKRGQCDKNKEEIFKSYHIVNRNMLSDGSTSPVPQCMPCYSRNSALNDEVVPSTENTQVLQILSNKSSDTINYNSLLKIIKVDSEIDNTSANIVSGDESQHNGHNAGEAVGDSQNDETGLMSNDDKKSIEFLHKAGTNSMPSPINSPKGASYTVEAIQSAQTGICVPIGLYVGDKQNAAESYVRSWGIQRKSPISLPSSIHPIDKIIQCDYAPSSASSCESHGTSSAASMHKTMVDHYVQTGPITSPTNVKRYKPEPLSTKSTSLERNKKAAILQTNHTGGNFASYNQIDEIANQECEQKTYSFASVNNSPADTPVGNSTSGGQQKAESLQLQNSHTSCRTYSIIQSQSFKINLDVHKGNVGHCSSSFDDKSFLPKGALAKDQMQVSTSSPTPQPFPNKSLLTSSILPKKCRAAKLRSSHKSRFIPSNDNRSDDVKNHSTKDARQFDCELDSHGDIFPEKLRNKVFSPGEDTRSNSEGSSGRDSAATHAIFANFCDRKGYINNLVSKGDVNEAQKALSIPKVEEDCALRELHSDMDQLSDQHTWYMSTDPANNSKSSAGDEMTHSSTGNYGRADSTVCSSDMMWLRNDDCSAGEYVLPSNRSEGQTSEATIAHESSKHTSSVQSSCSSFSCQLSLGEIQESLKLSPRVQTYFKRQFVDDQCSSHLFCGTSRKMHTQCKK